MVSGLLLPWRLGCRAPAPGWQLTPLRDTASSIDFEAMDEPEPTPHGGDLDSLQGESSGSWGLFISREVDDPGMIELLYSHQSTWVSPELPGQADGGYPALRRGPGPLRQPGWRPIWARG